MRRMRHSPALYLIPAMAFLEVLPLILRGCSCGHDFNFHILSWFEAAAQFRAGNLHPSWAFSPAFNAGEPRFVFYPPLSWTLGAILGLILPWGAVPIVYTWIALTASGAAMYRFTRQFSGTVAALLATAIYVANPYMLFTAYERTAYAELLAAAWLPLLLAAALCDRITMLGIAVPVALLWLTNAPAAVMGCYALALIALVRLVQTWFSVRDASLQATFKACADVALSCAAGTALGLALAAFYVLPAAYERRWVQIAMATISGMRITDNFLFHHTADALHDQVLHTASGIAIMLITTAGVAFLFAITQRRTYQRILVPLAILSAGIAIMLTPASALIWRIAPEMAFLQFPWRLLAVLASTACAAIAISLDRSESQVPPNPSVQSFLANARGLSLISLCLVTATLLPSFSVFKQPCDNEDTVAARLALFNAKTGTDPTDEYTPTDADNDSLSRAAPAFWLTDDPGGKPPASSDALGLVTTQFSIIAPKEETLILNLRDYPAWQVKINGLITQTEALRDDGLMAIPVHAGILHVDLAYVEGRDHTVGNCISLVALAAALALGMKQSGHAKASRIIVV